MKNICAIIPARYKSSRLFGKPLLKINGQTIISMTYQQTCKSKYIDKVYVATDDERIKEEVESIGGNVFMITEECLNGTERICKCLSQLSEEYDLIVNIQGDEPYVSPNVIDYMIEKHLENRDKSELVCTTIHTKIKDLKHLYERSFGKMVIDQKNNIMYCSRNIIPGTKTNEINNEIEYLTHIGIFIFERDFLPKYIEYPNTPLQLSEDIEWLKIMEMGYRIKSYEIDEEYEIGVNTPEDYQYLLNKYQY
jgi:3-deoxy-manno-octulosonate cytidylyltransferase (CMP-KDO synthetase)